MNNINLIVSIFVVIIIFLLLREFWCWYFKINKITQLIGEQLAEQKKSNKILNEMVLKNPRKSNHEK